MHWTRLLNFLSDNAKIGLDYKSLSCISYSFVPFKMMLKNKPMNIISFQWTMILEITYISAIDVRFMKLSHTSPNLVCLKLVI